MLTALFWTALIAAPAPEAPPKDALAAKELFAKEDWYKGQKGKEQEFIGVLKYSPRAKDVIGFGRFNPYTLDMGKEGGIREVYVGGKEDILKEFAGKRVKFTGKPVLMEVEGRAHSEIWPARVTITNEPTPKVSPKDSPANPAKEDQTSSAPVVAAARAPAPKDGEPNTPKIIASSAARFGVKGGEATQLVIRSAEELAKTMPVDDPAKASESAALMLKVKEIDWQKQMIIVVSAGTKRSGGYSVEITKLEINNKDLVVKWKVNSPAPNQPVTLALTHPSQTILVDKFDGKVVFDPIAPKGEFRPPIKRPIDNLKPPRIQPGTLPVVPEKPDPNKPIKICGDTDQNLVEPLLKK